MFSCNLSREFGAQTMKDRVVRCYFYFSERNCLKESFIDLEMQECENWRETAHVF
jgi:hypothetical protein